MCDFNRGPYEAVILALSLHHVESLDRAVDSVWRLLAPGGRLIVDEFAHERADGEIADRFYASPASLGRWREHHRTFHTGTAMVDAISECFDITSLANVPYLHRYLEDESLRDFEAVLGIQLTAVPANGSPQPPPHPQKEHA